MKSTPPSAPSKPSTPKEANAVARCFSPRPHCEIPTPRCRSQARKSLGTLAITTLAAVLSLAIGACRQIPNTPPPLTNEIRSELKESISISTPSAGWNIEIIGLYRTQRNYICVSKLSPPEGMAASVISEVELSFSLKKPTQPLPFRHYVLGKTWKWNANPEVTFIDSLDEIKDALAEAQSVPFTTP